MNPDCPVGYNTAYQWSLLDITHNVPLTERCTVQKQKSTVKNARLLPYTIITRIVENFKLMCQMFLITITTWAIMDGCDNILTGFSATIALITW